MTSLTEALPLIKGFSNQISFLLKKYMREVHPWMKQIFQDASYAYVKDDLASIQRPGIFIYPMSGYKNSYADKYNGKIVMELHFSLKEQRESLAQNVIQIAEDIALINASQQFTIYMQQYMPGLFAFGKEFRADYSKVYAKESIVKLEFDFWIDLVAYAVELQNMGCDITSPDQQIYEPAQALGLAIAVMDNPPNVSIVTGVDNELLEVNTNLGIHNLCINPEDNDNVLSVETF